MEKLLLLAVVVGTAAIVILMIYLISRVEKIETIALHGPQPKGSLAVLNADKPFLGLQGVDLWDLLSGNPPRAMPPMTPCHGSQNTSTSCISILKRCLIGY